MLPDPRPYFANLPDPRRETRNKLHELQDILMTVFCAVLSGIEDWVGMEEFGKQKETWLREFLALPNGIPWHDTLSDVFGRLNPEVFAKVVFVHGKYFFDGRSPSIASLVVYPCSILSIVLK